MSDPFVAEIRIFPFNFPPKGWAFCDGQLMAISQNTALFSLLGTTYGGDGRSTFALPNLQGSVPMHPNSDGTGQGLSQHFLGEESGVAAVTLLTSEMPLHAHNVGRALDQLGNSTTPVGSIWAQVGSVRATVNSYNPGPPTGAMKTDVIQPTGSSFPHNNMQPYLTLNFCIALQGVFPARP
jgi:microcystin-dependent protein